MEELNSAEEDSVFLSADEDDYQTSCSDDSGGQSDGERSKRGGGEGDGVTILSTNGGAQEELGLAAGVQQYCECQRVYLEAQNSKKTLHVLSIGLVIDDGTQLFSFDNDPWSKLPKASMRPQNLEYLREINRRAELYDIVPRPRPSNWKRPRIMKWLQDNPVREVDCKAFLFAEVKKLRDILLRLQEQATESAPTRTSKWRGTVPYLRIIMCLTEDHVKHLFLNRANARTRQEIDGRNSENRAKTVFEVIAEMWNSSWYNPVAPPSTCHIDFQTATDCSFEAVSTLQAATPQKIQDIFASMRCNLLRIIQNWERSGQGEGGTDETTSSDAEESGGSAVVGNDNVMGGLQGRPARALESRAAFLYGRPSYVLYFWEIADRHQLLQSSLQRLRDSVGASDASAAPSVVNTNRTPTSRRRRRDDDEDEEDGAALVRPLVQSIRDFAKDEDRRQVALLKSQSDERVFRRRAQLVDEARKYRRLIAELDSNDPRSSSLSDFYKKESLEIEEEIRNLDSGS